MSSIIAVEVPLLSSLLLAMLVSTSQKKIVPSFFPINKTMLLYYADNKWMF